MPRAESRARRDPVSPSSSQIRAALLLAAVFLAVMALFFTYHDQYRDVGGNLIAGGDFAQSPIREGGANTAGGWRARGPSLRWEPQGGVDYSGGVRLGTHEGRGSNLGYTVDNPRRFRFLRLSGRLRADDIVVGDQAWNTARLLLFFTDRDGRSHLQRDHVVCVITGTQSWRHCERVFPVPDFAVTARIHVQNLAASGALWIDELRLTPVIERSSTIFWRLLFAALWCGVLAYCVWSARLSRQPLGPLIIAIALLIVFGVAVPEPVIEQIVYRGTDTAKELLNDQSSDASKPGEAQVAPSTAPAAPPGRDRAQPSPLPFATLFTVKQIGHFVLFSLLAFLTFLSVIRRWRSGSPASRPTAAFATVTAALLIFAAGAEILQFLTTTRRPSLFDWGIDAGGIVFGAAIALAIRRVARTNPAPGPAA